MSLVVVNMVMHGVIHGHIVLRCCIYSAHCLIDRVATHSVVDEAVADGLLLLLHFLQLGLTCFLF
jgi:hypothetical protein